MKLKSTLALALIWTACAAAAMAQQPGATGGVAVGSEPGRAAAVRGLELSATVVAIDKAARTVTLKGAKGHTVDVVAGDEVKNFDQIKLGDVVSVRYIQALALALRKSKAPAGDVTVSEGSTQAKPGERPAAAGERRITAIAEVVALDPKEKTVTLKGPRGNDVTLDVQNPDQFKVLEKGDQVNVTYTEALAISVEPAPKPASTK